MPLAENSTIYNQVANYNGYAVPAMRVKEHDDFYDGVEKNILESLDSFKEWDDIEIWTIESLPTTWVCNDGTENSIFFQWYREDFKPMWNLPYSEKLLDSGISVLSEYKRMHNEDWTLNIEKIALQIKSNIDYLKEKKWNEEKIFSEIKKILFITEEFIDNYTSNEVINAMRTGETIRDSDSSSTLVIKWKDSELTEEEMLELNNIIFKVDGTLNIIKNYILNLIWI